MWHLVCGDNAVAGVAHCIGAETAKQSLRVMRDDLAVGPLADIDTPPCQMRSDFWQQLWPASVQSQPDFGPELSSDALWLKDLAQQTQAVTVWDGDSASEQLLLARVAAALESSSVELWRVACGTGDSRVVSRKAVAMHAPDTLAALHQPRLLSAAQRQQLAAQWHAAVAENAAIRRWRDGAFHGVSHKHIRQHLLHFCTDQWQPLNRVMASVMVECDGFFATDFFLWWCARELVASGQLVFSAPLDTAYAEQTVKCS
ncbi:DUF3658 domain-containing protein [Pseudomonas sp. RL_15y_Pfl2_60]|uniref:DUF3658 domain-containing protein n=1 Tax=Pseudomonas sp. RL_15y_Pfl2_60 TaxID=3088709 RepID=UPI0030DAAD5A